MFISLDGVCGPSYEGSDEKTALEYNRTVLVLQTASVGITLIRSSNADRKNGQLENFAGVDQWRLGIAV